MRSKKCCCTPGSDQDSASSTPPVLQKLWCFSLYVGNQSQGRSDVIMEKQHDDDDQDLSVFISAIPLF